MSEVPQPPAESNDHKLPLQGSAAAHSRRVFLFKLAVMLNGAVGAVLAVPLLGFVLAPAFKRSSRTGSWIRLGELEQFPVGQTRLAEFRSPVASLDDGQTAKIPCWVRHVSARQVQVFAINCAHLGCPVRWFAQSKLFLCPCHGGTYYEDGSRASGPPERGLFKYRTRLEGNTLMIHAGDMPTLATQASCGEKPLIQIEPAAAASRTYDSRSTSWRA